MGYFLLASAFIILFFASLGISAAYKIAHKKSKPDVDINDYKFTGHEPEYEKKILEWIKSIDFKYFWIVSPYFYKLNALEIISGSSEKWIILLHGVTVDHKSMLDLAYAYSEMGYNILLFDSRHHGKSEGKNISYGYYEKHDLKAVVDYLRNKFGRKTKIGIHGISMGAGVLLSYASGVRDDCDFYIADCPYSNFRKQAYDVAKRKLRMPGFFVSVVMFFAQVFIRLFFGYDLNKINIAARIHRTENPMLFISCRDDDYIDPDMTGRLYDKCGSVKKEVIWFENGGHGGAFENNREEYIAGIKKFLINIGLYDEK